jgi:hypothetical protein
MSKFIQTKDASGYSFSHDFSSEDWRKISSLAGRRSGSVMLSEGSASIDDNYLTITLPSPGGHRSYELFASNVFG